MRDCFYRTIVADPPWQYDKQTRKDAEAHYRTMTVKQIMAVPVSQWALPESHLYLWTTSAFMVEAHQVAHDWGFTVKTIIAWVKVARGSSNPESDLRVRLGLGNYYRNALEFVLFGVQGSLLTESDGAKNQPNVFFAPRGRHSEKPDAFFDMVEKMSCGPYLSVFERRLRLGWDSMGDEIGTVL